MEKLVAEQAAFVANMGRAVEIARNDPGAGTDVLRFYTDLLIKNRNVDYLVNRVSMYRPIFEVFNLDIAVLAFTFMACLGAAIFFCVLKCVKFYCGKVMSKNKID